MKKILVMIMCLMFMFTSIGAQEINGVLSVDGFLDSEQSEDLNLNVGQLSLNVKDTGYEIYSTYEDSTGTFYLNEAHIDLTMSDIDMEIGKIVAQFGLKGLNRAENSMFLTYSRPDYEEYGLTLSTGNDKINFRGSYVGDGDYTLMGELNLFEGGNKFSVSFNDSKVLEEKYGNWAISNVFLYESVLMNFSLTTEWMPDNGDFWTRMVTGPGIFDFFGIMGGYYDVKNLEGKFPYTSDGDAWSVGFYFDIAKRSTVSVEWLDDNIFNPIAFKLVTNF